MHEYSLVQALIDRIEAEASQRHASKVERIVVRIGDRAGVERELFATAFRMCSERTICDGAVLEIDAAAGGDLMLDRIELEVSDV